jgi:hypothetical protein
MLQRLTIFLDNLQHFCYSVFNEGDINMRKTGQKLYSVIMVSVAIYAIFALSACSGSPKKEDLAYLEHQVYQCKMVCTSGLVNTMRVSELGCDCSRNKQETTSNNQPQVIVIPMQSAPQPIIINNASGGYTPVPASYQTPNRTPATTQEEVKEEKKEEPKKTGGVSVTLPNGRTLFSMGK